MAEYHSTLKELEELVQTRIRLISRGSSHWGVEKCINITLSTLHRENSMPARAEEYCRRLKIVRQQLGGYAMGDLDALIAKQESLVGGSRPNVSKVRNHTLAGPHPLTLFIASVSEVLTSAFYETREAVQACRHH